MQIKSNFFLNTFLHFVLLLFCNSFVAQKFDVTIEKNNLNIGETVQIEYVFSGNGDNFNPPDFKHFNQVGSYQSSSYKVINGNMSAEMVFTFIIQSTKSGTFTIEPAQIEYKGKVIISKPLTLKVSNKKAQNNSNYEIFEEDNQANKSRIVAKPNIKSNELIFIDAVLNKNSLYINEPIEVDYVLYIHPRLKFQAENIKKPSYKGFWSQFEDINQEWQEVQVGNKIYYAKTFRKTKLIPQKSGNLSIDPLSIDMILQVPTGREDFWGDEEYNNVRKKIVCKEKKIKVNDLPIQGKPNDFTGAVGTFDYDVKIDKSELKTGEMIKMDLIVSGKGNLNLFDIPKPLLPYDFEIFEPKRDDQITENISGISGKIIDSYTIIPHEKGNFNLNPPKFSYFDIKTKKYKTLSKESIKLNILKGNKTFVSKKHENITLADNPFMALTTANFSKIGTSSFFSSPKSIWLAVSPLLLLPFFYFRNKKEIVDSPSEEKKPIIPVFYQQKKSSDYFAATRNSVEKDLFYNNLIEDLNAFLLERYNVSIHEDKKENFVKKLTEKGLSEEHIHIIQKIVKNAEMARYSPINTDSMSNDLFLAEKIVKRTDEVA